MGCNVLYIARDKSIQIVVAASPEIVPSTLAKTIVSGVNSSPSLKQIGRTHGTVSKCYVGLLEPHFAITSAFIRDSADTRAILKAIDENRIALRQSIETANRDQIDQSDCRVFMSLTRHGEGNAIYCRNVATVANGIQSALESIGSRMVLVNVQPQHAHVVATLPDSLSPEQFLKQVRSRSSKAIQATAPWLTRTVHNRRISFWDRDNDARACAVRGDGAQGLERYVRQQYQRHHDWTVKPASKTYTHRTQRIFYGERAA
jgi:REP element-mobilizing transposase RayT